MNEMQKKHDKFMEEMTIASMVDLIVLKATDESGDRLFGKSEDRHDLMGEESSIISLIAAKMFSTIESVEEQEKN